MELEIKRVGNDGEGIAYLNGLPVFIYGDYLNEVVKVEVIKNSRGSLEGNILEIIKSSPYRVPPIYSDIRLNTASNLSHISYGEQLKFKRDTIKFLVKTRLRKLSYNINVLNTVSSPLLFNYRNKVDLPVKFINGKNEVGLYVRGSNEFIKIDSYITHQKEVDLAIKDILSLMDELNINAYNEKYKKGAVTNLSVRSNLEGKIQVTIVIKEGVNLRKLAFLLMQRNNNIVSVFESYVPNLKTNRDMFSGKLNLLSGANTLTITLGDYKFLVNPESFFQLNTNQALNLYNEIIKLGNFKKTDVVLDAFSGVGTIATFISPYVKQVVAIESVKQAVNAMEQSFKINNIKNVKAITGDVIKVVKYLKMKYDCMLFDPPRSGLGDELLNFILKEEPKKIIYTSCGPESLMYDLDKLSLKYDFNEIKPFDMFPQTSHVELVALMSRVDE